MKTYTLLAKDGRHLSIVEAEDQVAAEMYGRTNVVGYHRLREAAGAAAFSSDEVTESLAESFRAMGLSEAAAKIASEGRADVAIEALEIPRVRVDRRGKLQSIAEPARRSSDDSPGALAESFEGMGLSADEAAIAARGRDAR